MLKRLRKNIFRLRVVKRLNRKLRSFKLTGGLQFSDLVDGEYISPERVIEKIKAGHIVKIEGLGKSCDLKSSVENILGCSYERLSALHQENSTAELLELTLSKRGDLRTLELQTKIIASFCAASKIDRYYTELEPNLRLQPPYQDIKSDVNNIEKAIGSGQLTPHSVHKDSWYYHPKDTMNIWVALTEANSYAGLSILPNSQNLYPKTDGQKFSDFSQARSSQHVELNLKAGEAVIFLAELVHGSIINQLNKTRATLSMRFSLERPNNHVGRMYWYNGTKINDNCVSFDYWAGLNNGKGDFDPKELEGQSLGDSGLGQFALSYDENYIQVEFEDGVKSFPRYCPHQGVDLLNGHVCHKTQELVCPSHRLKIKCKHGEESR